MEEFLDRDIFSCVTDEEELFTLLDKIKSYGVDPRVLSVPDYFILPAYNTALELLAIVYVKKE